MAEQPSNNSRELVQENEQIADYTAKKQLPEDKKPESKVPEQLQEHAWKPGESGNPAGRPKGSKNLTTIVMETLRAKKYQVKDSSGAIIEIDGTTAFAEAVLENAIKKKDRESLRMIWEHSDGKPTQRTEMTLNGPKGYEVSPEQEKQYDKQFGVVASRYEVINEPETPQNEPEQAKLPEPSKDTKPTPKPSQQATEPATGVNQKDYAGDNQQTPRETVQESNTGGVREA